MSKFTAPAEVIAFAESLPEVYSTNAWPAEKPFRVYLNLVGYDKSARGDRTLKVYYDFKLGNWVLEEGKGCRSVALRENLDPLLRKLGFTDNKYGWPCIPPAK